MDADRFDVVVRSLSTARPRRGLLGGLAAVTLGAAAVSRQSSASAKKKRKKKLKFNQFGCIDVGKPCRGNDGFCCSGICEGNRPRKGAKDRSRCVAHHIDICTSGQSSCPEPVPCGGVNGNCFQTTGKAGYCGDSAVCDCHACKKDKDCVDAGYGEGSACIICISSSDRSCVGVNDSSGTACVPPG